jgi:hypothetical protein
MVAFLKRFAIGLFIGSVIGLLIFVPPQLLKNDVDRWTPSTFEPTPATIQVCPQLPPQLSHYPLEAQITALVDLLTAAHNRANLAAYEAQVAGKTIEELLEVIQRQQAYIEGLKSDPFGDDCDPKVPTIDCEYLPLCPPVPAEPEIVKAPPNVLPDDL